MACNGNEILKAGNVKQFYWFGLPEQTLTTSNPIRLLKLARHLAVLLLRFRSKNHPTKPNQ